MNNFIGRPPDPNNTKLLCPKCGKNNMCKAGFHVSRTKRGKTRRQMYVCNICNFHTIKPVVING